MESTKRNINVSNGNPLAWITAAELTDEEVKNCLDSAGRFEDSEYYIDAFEKAALEADTDREWLQIFADYLTANDPKFADGVVFY